MFLGLVEQCGLVSKKVGPGFCIASGIFPNVITKKICSSFAFKNRDGLRLVMYFEQKRLGGSRITGLPHKTWLVHLTDCTLYNEMGQPKLEGESSISIPLCTKNQKVLVLYNVWKIIETLKMTRKNAKQKFFVYLFKANNLKKLKVLILFFHQFTFCFILQSAILECKKWNNWSLVTKQWRSLNCSWLQVCCQVVVSQVTSSNKS